MCTISIKTIEYEFQFYEPRVGVCCLLQVGVGIDTVFLREDT